MSVTDGSAGSQNDIGAETCSHFLSFPRSREVQYNPRFIQKVEESHALSTFGLVSRVDSEILSNLTLLQMGCVV